MIYLWFILELLMLLLCAVLWALMSMAIGMLFAEYLVPYITKLKRKYVFHKLRQRDAYVHQLWQDIETLLNENKRLLDILNEQEKKYPLFYWKYL
jgi:hypothetical protein